MTTYVLEDLPGSFQACIRVDPLSGCWLWIRGRNGAGYGSYRQKIDGVARQVPAHRLIYELLCGKIPDGLHLDHLCRVHCCVNPAHLEPVTPKVNALRGMSPLAENARKTHCKYGHELTPENTYTYEPGTGVQSHRRRSCRKCAVQRQAVYSYRHYHED